MAKKPTKMEQIGTGFDDVLGTVLKKSYKGNAPHTLKEAEDSNYNGLFESLEKIKQIKEGLEYWHARDLQEILDYTEWRNFENSINKAKEACKNSNQNEIDHFVDVNKMVDIGSGTKRNVKDILLTRYACYLIAQNGDPEKKEIAFAQTYFAIGARKSELLEQRMKELERIEAREKLQESEKRLSSVVYQRGFGEKDFGIMRSMGDQALFGKPTAAMKRRLSVPKGRPLADFADTVIIRAKSFSAAMTAYNAEKQDLFGVGIITKEHVANNYEIRNALKKRGIIPEDLPPQEDIKKVERRLKKEQVYIEDKTNEKGINHEYSLTPIDISKDLWKYALMIMSLKPGGIVTTTELIDEIPNYIEIPEKYMEKSIKRNEGKYVQIIRNLVSNRRNKTNFITQGYANVIEEGLQITKKGLDFVKEYFKDI